MKTYVELQSKINEKRMLEYENQIKAIKEESPTLQQQFETEAEFGTPV